MGKSENGWEHGKGVVRIGMLFLRDKCLIFLFSVGDLPTLEQLFALVLYFTYSRLYQTLLEYIGVICYHLIYTTINSVWGLLSHLLYFLFIGKYYLSTHNTSQLEVSLLSKSD